jgi:hypothetical protein
MGGGGAVWRMSGFSIYFLQFVELERNRPLLNCKGIWNSCQTFCQRTLQPFRWEWLYGWYSFINDLKQQLQSQNKSKMLNSKNYMHQKVQIILLYICCILYCNLYAVRVPYYMQYSVLCLLYVVLCMLHTVCMLALCCMIYFILLYLIFYYMNI